MFAMGTKLSFSLFISILMNRSLLSIYFVGERGLGAVLSDKTSPCSVLQEDLVEHQDNEKKELWKLLLTEGA